MWKHNTVVFGDNTWLNMLTWNDKSYKAFLLCYFNLVAEGVCSRHAVRRWWSDSGVVQLGTIFFTTWNFDSFLNFLKLAVRSLRKKGPPATQPLVPYVGGGLWTQSKALSCPATQPIPHYISWNGPEAVLSNNHIYSLDSPADIFTVPWKV